MSKYVENHLRKDEVVVIKAKKNWLYLLPTTIILIVVLGVAIFAQTQIKRYTNPVNIYVSTMVRIDLAEFDSETRYLTQAEQDVYIELYNFANDEDIKSMSELRKSYKAYLEEKYTEEAKRYSTEQMAREVPEISDVLTTVETVLTSVVWVAAALIAGIPFLKRLFNLLSINLVLTNKRVVGKIGILKIHSLDIPIDKVDHVEIKASAFGNLFRYYELRIFSIGGSGFNSGSKGEGDKFVAISNAQAFKDAVTDAVEKHAAEARKAQAEEIASAMSTRPQQ